MHIMFIVLFVLMSVLLLLGTIGQLIRLEAWSRFVNSEIDRVFNARIAGDRSVPYPNIEVSYHNFESYWYNPFAYDFKSMIVYDSTH